MNCQNCKVKISAEFTYAISKNNCPKCGKQIMAQENLAGFLGLKELLKDHVSDIDKIAGLIVANFDIKQRFVSETIADIKVEEEEDSIQLDARERAKLMEQKKLKQLRDEALIEAKYQASLADALSDNPSPDVVEEEVQENTTRGTLVQTRQQIYNNSDDVDIDKMENVLANYKNKKGIMPTASPNYTGPKVSRND